MLMTIFVTVSVTLWCLFSFVLYGYYYILEVVLDLPIVGESPCSAHTALKRIIQKIIREADNLPELKSRDAKNVPVQLNQSYEDLLSTAILNKIISNSQNNLTSRACSSRANSVCSHISSSSKRRKIPNREFFFGEESLENKWKNVDTDTGSVSSLEEWVHSDSSLGSKKYVDRKSLTIKQRIDEVSSGESDQDAEEILEDDNNSDFEYFRSNSAFSNFDEPNWFLKKRQFGSGTSSPIPVPMLVPDPTTEAKVLIGDKEIDETSDLSDVENLEEDVNDDSLIVLNDVKNHLIDSKRLIGGRNPLAELSFIHHSDDEVSADSGVKECKDLDEGDHDSFSTSNRNAYEFPTDLSICSDGSITEKDTEYTEKYATLPKTITISPKNNRAQNNKNDKNNKGDEEDKDSSRESEDENHHEFTGAYSRREKEKWKHAVEIKNNPYSKENIEKRINSKNSLNSLFGSDYYIKQACLPSGAKKTEAENEINSQETEDLPEEQIENVTENQVIPITPILKSPCSDVEVQNFSYSEITSDSDVSLVNCYDVTESVIYKKITAENKNEEIQSAEKFFDFESLDEVCEPAVEKPVAKPRKSLSQSQETSTESTRKMISNSEMNEDVPVPYIISKRSDNTLIKRIYSNPSVRTFALNNRIKLPIETKDDNSNVKTCNEEKNANHFPQKTTSPEIKKIMREIEDVDCFYSKAFVFSESEEEMNKVREDKQNNIKQNQSNSNGNIKKISQKIKHSKNINSEFEAIDEINKLKEKKLVANRLRAFSKSSHNLFQISTEILDKDFGDVKINGIRKHSIDFEKGDCERKFSKFETGERSTSVKDLRRKFEQFEAYSVREKPILYSLTGRSISKQFKEKLRDINKETSLSQIHSLSLTNLEVEENSR